MMSYDGIPMVCSGSMIHGAGEIGIMVDETPVMVQEALAAAEDQFVAFTRGGVAVYVAADAPITGITPMWAHVTDAAT